MKYEITIQEKTFDCEVKCFCEEIQSEKDFKQIIALISIIAADYDLDPELEIDDLQGIIDKVKTEAKNSYSFLISEEGIEVDI